MPTVYILWGDEDCQALDPVSFEEYDRESRTKKSGVKSWSFDGTKAKKDWKPLEVYVREPKLTKPDIWPLANTFAMERDAAVVLQLPLDQSCEQLMLPFEHRKLIVMNVTYVLECLDTKKSKYDPDTPHHIDKFVFHADRLDYSLFKIPQNPQWIFTVEGLAAPDDEFKPLVENHGLKGVRFQEVWSWK
jgi:hypothetical protein